MRWLVFIGLLACSNAPEPPPPITQIHSTLPVDCVLLYTYGMECMTIWHWNCQGQDVWNAEFINQNLPACQSYQQSLEDAGYIKP
jgi:hypothetical protein